MPRLPIHRDSLGGVVYPDSQYSGFDPLTRARNRLRIRILLSAVIVSLMIALSYTFLRPAIYESSATLLVTPPVIDDRASDVTNAQHVELELQLLSSHALLSGVLENISSAALLGDTPRPTLPELQEMLAVASIENTNLIELSARGPDKHLLPSKMKTVS
jgi:capsular polysaccharide biosynthesis protein